MHWINIRADYESLPMDEAKARQWLADNKPDVEFHALDETGIWTVEPGPNGPTHKVILWKDIQ